MDATQDDRHTNWGWFYYRIVDDFGPVIKADGVAVYMVLVRYASNDTRASWPAIPTIAQKLGISERQVRYTLDRLVAAGLIAIEPRMVPTASGKSRQTSNLYRLLPLADAPPANIAAPASIAPDPLQILQPPPANIAPELDVSNKTQENKRGAASSPAPIRDLHPVPKGTAIKARPDAPPVLKQTLCPATFPVTSEMQEWAEEHTPELAADLPALTGLFSAYYRSKGEKRADWYAAWQGFMWRKREDARKDTARATPKVAATVTGQPYRVVGRGA